MSEACGVGHPDKEESVSHVRSADARSRQYRRPEGVTASFQVRLNKVEPAEAVSARNLLSKDCWRDADEILILAEEVEPDRPEVSSVVEAPTLSCGAKGLAGAASRPNGSIIWPASESEGMTPNSDAREGVELRVRANVRGGEDFDAARIHDSRGDEVSGREVSEPLRRVGVELVVEGRHDPPSFS